MARQPSADDFVGQLLGLAAGEGMDGWAGIENAGARLKALNEAERQADVERATREHAIIVGGLSADPQARMRLLVLLARKTLLRGPAADEFGATTAEAYAIAKARREGANGVVLMLLSVLAGDDGDKIEGESE